MAIRRRDKATAPGLLAPVAAAPRAPPPRRPDTPPAFYAVSAHGPGTHPQLLDHRAHRPRQVDAGGSHPRADAHGGGARDAGAAAGLDGPGARAGDHDQGAGGARVLHGARRRDLPAAPDRHAGPRRLHIRGVALAGGVRGRALGGRRGAGRGGADGREHLPGGRIGPRADPVPEQDRPARRGAGAGGGRSERADRRAAGGHPEDQRQDGGGRGGGAGGADRARAAAVGRPAGSAAGADLRLGVRPVPRRDRLHPRGRRHRSRRARRSGRWRRARRRTSTTSACSARR